MTDSGFSITVIIDSELALPIQAHRFLDHLHGTRTHFILFDCSDVRFVPGFPSRDVTSLQLLLYASKPDRITWRCDGQPEDFKASIS